MADSTAAYIYGIGFRLQVYNRDVEQHIVLNRIIPYI
jgi:hypothetical protein